MKHTVVGLIAVLFLLVGCSSMPDNPRLSFGKKCEVSKDGTVVTSHVWIYDKTQDLTANKESCNIE
jgi:uncharacterized lipoprotein NlpE involved in copper resistance|tara:strand:- start:523 stop:720 length:198 start_codon:yes stop_codon:yes gene_type:complete